MAERVHHDQAVEHLAVLKVFSEQETLVSGVFRRESGIADRAFPAGPVFDSSRTAALARRHRVRSSA